MIKFLFFSIKLKSLYNHLFYFYRRFILVNFHFQNNFKLCNTKLVLFYFLVYYVVSNELLFFFSWLNHLHMQVHIISDFLSDTLLLL